MQRDLRKVRHWRTLPGAAHWCRALAEPRGSERMGPHLEVRRANAHDDRSAGRIFVFACAGRDALVAILREAGGDPAAIALAIRALPSELDKGLCRGIRNDKIRAISGTLLGAMPGASMHFLASLIEKAGRELDRGGNLARLHDFDHFERAELKELQSRVIAALAWCTPRHDGRRWPKLRQLLNLL